MGKGCHPLSAAIYLKHIEGRTRFCGPIHPKSISARTHALTRMPNFENQGHLRDSYTDIEDYAMVHIVFDDGTIADITASELVHGGIKNCVEVHANNHRSICNIAPNDAMLTYNPLDENFRDIYVGFENPQGGGNFTVVFRRKGCFYRAGVYGGTVCVGVHAEDGYR